MLDTLIAVYNPSCGDRSAKSFFQQHVFPLLLEHEKVLAATIETKGPLHAGEALLEAIHPYTKSVTVILGSGDGTLHDIINYLLANKTLDRLPKIHFALVPCGTANALYWSLFASTPKIDEVERRLQSLKAYLTTGRSHTLNLATTIFSSVGPESEKKPVTSLVVTSTCLHACILRDSEILREKIPGIDRQVRFPSRLLWLGLISNKPLRFKVAAQQNSTKWYESRATFYPTPNDRVQIYDPNIGDFIPHPGSSADSSIVQLDGPFAYFLSAVNVDRLEPLFRITPLVSQKPPAKPSCDVVVVRPLRDPSLTNSSIDSRAAFSSKLWAIMGGAYQDGSHINLKYDSAGNVALTGDGISIVEYIRCGGWEWNPVIESYSCVVNPLNMV